MRRNGNIRPDGVLQPYELMGGNGKICVHRKHDELYKPRRPRQQLEQVPCPLCILFVMRVEVARQRLEHLQSRPQLQQKASHRFASRVKPLFGVSQICQNIPHGIGLVELFLLPQLLKPTRILCTAGKRLRAGYQPLAQVLALRA